MRQRPARNSYTISSQLLLRSLGCVYLIAFLSLWVQIHGLVGSEGILPVQAMLEGMEARLGAGAYWRLPTLCWLSASDGFLHLLAGAGVFLALYAAVFPSAAWVWLLLWAAYLSLTVAGQTFLNFQWDALLLEVGFLGVFLAPPAFLPRWTHRQGAPDLALWLVRWLLFRFMLLSGLAKLASRDPVWLDFTALEVHYMTQPLPPWSAWYVHHLPGWFHKASVGCMFFIELAVPFSIFMRRSLRLCGAALLIALQLVIIATGNYGFFNLLTIALCLPLIDDAFWDTALSRLRKRKARDERVPEPAYYDPQPPNAGAKPLRRWPKWLLAPVLGVVFLLSLPPTLGTVLATFRQPTAWLLHFEPLERYFRPLRLANGYGLFADMTEERPEIVLEGSSDAATWKEYEFRYKPGEPARRPPFVAPHMPRLDWQMWFAALAPRRAAPWFEKLCRRLLEKKADVLDLLELDPFPEAPPRQIRALLYRYEFASPEEKRRDGVWWKRELLGVLFGPASLRQR